MVVTVFELHVVVFFFLLIFFVDRLGNWLLFLLILIVSWWRLLVLLLLNLRRLFFNSYTTRLLGWLSWRLFLLELLFLRLSSETRSHLSLILLSFFRTGLSVFQNTLRLRSNWLASSLVLKLNNLLVLLLDLLFMSLHFFKLTFSQFFDMIQLAIQVFDLPPQLFIFTLELVNLLLPY